MTKQELVKSLAAETGLTQGVVDNVLKSFAKLVTEKVVGEGETVAIHEFGTFSCKVRKAGVFRNPMNGSEVHKPETRTLSFKASHGTRKEIVE